MVRVHPQPIDLRCAPRPIRYWPETARARDWPLGKTTGGLSVTQRTSLAWCLLADTFDGFDAVFLGVWAGFARTQTCLSRHGDGLNPRVAIAARPAAAQTNGGFREP